MFKFLLKCCTFMLLFLVALSISDNFFKSFKLTEKTMEEYKKVDALDIAIFGSSHAHSSYDPRVFESELGLQTFNFGAAAQRFENTKLVAEYITERTPPKLAIIDIYKNSLMGFDDEITAGLQYETLDNLPFSIEKMRTYFNMGAWDDFLFNYSTTVRNHSNWGEFSKKNITRHHYIFQNSEIYRGLRTSNDCFTEGVWEKFKKKYKGKENKEYTFELSKKEKAKIDALLKVFNDKNIPVLFVNAPSYVNDYEANARHYASLISRYLREKGLMYIDYNKLRDSLGLQKGHFKDPNHLNGKGAYIVSNHLSGIIAARFDLNDKNYFNTSYPLNRYKVIQRNFEDAKFLKVFDESDPSTSGIFKAAIVKVDTDRFDIILQTDQALIDDIRIKINYTIKPNEQRLLPSSKLSVIDNNVRMFDNLSQCNLYKIDGSHYIIFSFQYTLDDFKNFKLLAGDDLKTTLFHIVDNNIK